MKRNPDDDMDRLYGAAIARFGLTPRQVYEEVTPREMYYAMEDFESTNFGPSRNLSEVMRMVAFYVFNTSVKKKDRARRPSDLFKFSWERVTKTQTLEEQKNALHAIAAAFKNRNKEKGERKKKKKKKDK